MGSLEKKLLSPDGKTSVGYLDSPEAIRLLQWLNAYYRDSGLKTPKSLIDTYQQFGNHQVGMVTGRPSLQWNTEDKDIIGLAPLPHFADGKRANPVSFDGYGISQKSKHPLEALKFIEYLTLTNNEDSIKLAESYVPTSKLMAEATGQSSDPIKSIFVEELNYATKSTERRFFNAWIADKDIKTHFEKLLTTEDKDIPAKLHELALKLDQSLKNQDSLSNQQTNSTSP
ncbi:extracellular solute-binding protein [Paenibacillus psychroresistens]|uniref:Extracellular solute-binding protein n=1 Tax=Paenibacillus psychroresistens TaxID=1778678 RepID=A0A6B8RU49_9BACL|nr:extracellular solute-binding protein [Paenibacillus psychroresistens]QGQ99322.1 extracellular solute-binding protein [Paenibacillus psychroresistens]